MVTVLFTFYIQCVLKLKKNHHQKGNLNASSTIINHPSHLSNVLGTTVHVQREWSLCPFSGLSLPHLSVQEAANYSPWVALGRTCDSDTAKSRSSKSVLMMSIAISPPLPNACYINIYPVDKAFTLMWRQTPTLNTNSIVNTTKLSSNS